MPRVGWLLIVAVLCVLAAAAYNDKPVLIMGGEPTVQALPGLSFAPSKNTRLFYSTPATMICDGSTCTGPIQ